MYTFYSKCKGWKHVKTVQKNLAHGAKTAFKAKLTYSRLFFRHMEKEHKVQEVQLRGDRYWSTC